MPTLNIWDLLMVIGVAQGMIMAAVLWFRKGMPSSAKFLAAIFFTLAWASLGTLISENEPEPVTRVYIMVMRYVPFYLIMLIGPSLLFLVQSQIDGTFQFDKQKKRHYWAILFNLIPSIGWMISWSAWKLDVVIFSNDSFAHFINGFYTYGDIFYWLHMLAYTFMARKHLLEHQPANRKLHEVITAFQLFLVVWFPFLVLYVSSYSDILEPFSYYPVFIPVTMLTYWLGFQWFFHLYRNKTPAKPLDIDRESIDKLVSEAMDQKIYLDVDLTVKSAARKIGIPQRVLSQYLNQILQQTFNDYINGYRVREVKRKLADEHYDHLTIAAIAHDSGFKSLATFQRAFQQAEGMKPNEYKLQLKKNAQITI